MRRNSTIKNYDGPGRDLGVLLATTGDDDRYRHTRNEAMKRASSSGQILILYDLDAPTLLGDPLPTWWSGEGSEDLFSRRLDQIRLRAAGRATIADQVGEAEAKGIMAFGWLPSRKGSSPLSEYAHEQGVTTVVVPADLNDLEGLQALGADEAGTTAQPGFTVIVVAEPVLEP